MEAQGPTKKKLRVLCFHGYRQNVDVFRDKTLKNFRQRCLNRLDIEYVYALSPHRMEEASQEEGMDIYKWWDTVPQSAYLTGGTATVGIDETLEFIAKFIADEEAKNGAFDGVLGYSQGGVLASLLCALASTRSAAGEHDELRHLRFDFKFGIFFCAFPVRAEPHKHVYEGLKDSQDMPTLHVWGQKDDLVPADYSKELVALFPSAVTFEHPTGHVVPTNSPAKTAYISFLQKFAS